MPAALAYLLTAAGVSAAVASTIVAFAIVAAPYALLLGGLAYSSMKARQAKAQARDAYNAAQVDRMVNITSSTAPRDLVLGRVRKGGTFAYKASTGTYQKDLYLAIALAGHEIDAIEAYYLNDELVTVDGSGNVTTAPYATAATLSGTIYISSGFTATIPATYVVGSVTVTALGTVSTSGADVIRDREISFTQAGTLITASEANATVHYQYTTSGSNVKITQHLGGAGQTVDADLLAAFPSDWASTQIAQGVAYVVAKLTYSEASFPSGAPNLTVVLRGAKLYDPRTGTTVWSENPALMMRHIYAHSKFGKATVTAAEDVRFIAAANACDTSTVYTVGGVAQAARALYKGSLVLPYGAAAKDAFDDLAQAMGGSWAFAGGELYLKAGVYTAPVMTLDDTDLAVVQRNGASESQKPIAIAVHKERAQKYNTVKVKIWDAGQDYKQSELTPLIASALVTRDGVELTQEVSYPAIGYAPQALHVAGIMMRDARDPLTVELPFKLRAYPLELFDTVSLTLSRFGWTAKTFMILGRVWNADGTLSLTLKETSAAITQMDAGFSAQGFASNTNLPKPWQIGSVGALTITSGTSELIKQADGTVQSRMRVSWSAVTDISVTQVGQIEVQFRAAGSSGAWTSLVVPGDETSVATSDVQDYATYTVRARCKTKLAVSDWNAQVAHQVIGKTAAPSNVAGLSYVTNETGVIFSYTANIEADYARTEFRVGATWATATIIEDPWLRPSTGTYTVLAKHFDTSGIESATAASITVNYTETPISNALVDAASIGAVKTDASNAPSSILNSTIAISGGAISGIGTGAGTVVDNSLVTATGIGAVKTDASNAPSSILNSTIAISGGAITGIGTGSGTSVANNVDSVITAPGGGIYTTKTTPTVNGALKIQLPTVMNTADPMIRFTVDIYEYLTGYSCKLEMGGHTSGWNWYNIFAQVVGGNVEYPVYFGHDGTHPCIWIGSAGESWSYPQVRIHNVFIGYSSMGVAIWETGWAISFDTSGAVNVTGTVTDTYPGANWAKIAGTGKPADNATANQSDAVTNAAIAAAQAAAIASANAGLADKLNKSAADILTGTITLNTGGMILAGTTSDGVYVSPAGIVGKTGGVTTFSVDGTTGAAVFKGDITGASGTFSGSLAANTITAASGAIADLAVTTGKIANLAVETLQIGDNAVTIPQGAFTAATLAGTSTLQNDMCVQAVQITSSGAPILIHAGVGCKQTYGGLSILTLFFCGTGADPVVGNNLTTTGYTSLGTVNFNADPSGSGLLSIGVMNMPPIIHTPGAGTWWYCLRSPTQTVSTSNQSTTNSRGLALLEIKK